MEAYRAQMEAEQRARSLEVTARLTDLARELRERDGQRLEEQRVCFKQLSLEMSEAEVLLDRARRDIESRLDKLESSKAFSEVAAVATGSIAQHGKTAIKTNRNWTIDRCTELR